MSDLCKGQAASIFVSYRIKDTLPNADRLAAELRRAFGKDQVFFDRRTVEPGETWDDCIEAAVKGAKVVLVLIGKQWLTVQDEHGRRRIDMKTDWVRREVAEALKIEGRVVPVLVDEASPVPAAALVDLPNMKKLASCQAAKLRTQDWDSDFNALVNLLTSKGLTVLTEVDSGQNVDRARAKRLQNSYFLAVKKEFEARTLLREDSMTLKDIYVPPMFSVVTSSLSEEVNRIEETFPDILEFLAAVFRYSTYQEQSVFKREHGLYAKTALERILIFGFPGEGKSSLCKRIAHDIVCGKIKGVRKVYLLPFRQIPMEEIEQFAASPLSYIRSWISRLVFQNRIKNIEMEIEGSIVLLDGLDEFDLARSTSDSGHSYVRLLHALFSAPSNLRLIVTSRHIDINEEALSRSSYPLVLHLRSFDCARQKTWLGKYRRFHDPLHLSSDLLNRINAGIELEAELKKRKSQQEVLEKKRRLLDERYAESKKAIAKARASIEFKLMQGMNVDKLEKKLQENVRYLTNLLIVKDRLPEIERITSDTELANKLRDEIEREQKNRGDLEQENRSARSKLTEKLNREAEDISRDILDPTVKSELDSAELDVCKNAEAINAIQAEIRERDLTSVFSAPIRELVSQPLLLYLLARLNIRIECGKEVSKISIYREMVSKLADELFGTLVKGDHYESATPKAIQELTKQEYRQLIGELAFAVFTLGKEIISFEEARETVTQFGTRFSRLVEENEKFIHSLLPTFYFKKSVPALDLDGRGMRCFCSD